LQSGASSDLAAFNKISEHDNAGAVVLPDHSPEVDDCRRLGRLRGDVLSRRVAALQPSQSLRPQAYDIVAPFLTDPSV